MVWPSILFPTYQVTEDNTDHIQRLTSSVRELQKLVRGELLIAGVGDDAMPNADTAVVDLVLDQSSHHEIDNPLDREPIGIMPLIAPGIVRPRWNMYSGTITVAEGSTTVTTSSGTFSTDMALGYLVAQSSKAKILDRPTSTTLRLYEPWPGTTDTGISATIMYKWDAASVWLYCGGTVGWPGLYRLMFF
jgi:hypothetical protein